jgi:hypothetical protein
MAKWLSVLIVFLLISPAIGMVYSWTDSGGITHYTNKEYEIPLRYRTKVKPRYPEQGDRSIPPQKVPASQGKQSVQTQPQALQSKYPKQANTNAELTVQQMKRESAARIAARRKRDTDDE